MLTATNFPLPGTMIAHGQLLPISANQALFSLNGTSHGGNGTTTSALPDLRGAEPQGRGSQAVTYVICGSGIYPSRP